MTNHIFRNQAVKQEMDRPTTKRQVDRYLRDLIMWKEWGYEFTEEQSRQLIRLWQVTKGDND